MSPEMRPFWMGWGSAIGLIAVATAGTGWVISATATWPLLPLSLARVGCVLIALLVFVAAFRLALLGTMALKRVLATNLAVLIAMELEELRRAADARARTLGAAPSPAPEPLPIPSFFGERKDIRKLLGQASERSLEDLLASLRDYNAAVSEQARGYEPTVATPPQEPARRLHSHIGSVLEAAQRALQTVAPFRRAGA